MIALVIIALSASALCWVAAVAWISGCVQDWAMGRGYPPVLLPWIICVFLGVIVPLAVVAQVLS